jgi:hypothetical protein
MGNRGLRAGTVEHLWDGREYAYRYGAHGRAAFVAGRVDLGKELGAVVYPGQEVEEPLSIATASPAIRSVKCSIPIMGPA